ncbi:predicted protein [Naegleria gruberi]|uniref:Predicted protein n=1 Tax=Naegleria gruberi TaxID=5762 RepID=D2VQC0_NAEGR|nr:uncharacterized protein NAEGRDRAFT_71172 [Naegleria gruberi]EFC40846.1 predicted protein [Naegleria gruberi]|eukprot:XP_002673590.1 predicted protein [Naegleria gruberi strain NEG-M]
MKQFKQSINLLKLLNNNKTTINSSSTAFKSIIINNNNYGFNRVNNYHHHSILQLNNNNNNTEQKNTISTSNNNININNNNNNSTQQQLEEQKFVISEDVESTPSSSLNNNTNTTNNNNTFNKNQQRIRIINSSSNNSNSSSSSSYKFTKTLKYSIIFTIASVVIYIIVETNNDRMNYYVSPSKVMDNRQDFPPDRKIRIGGIVKEGTIQHGENNFLTIFKITDLKYDIEIEYKGVLPDLFEENSTAICEGFMLGHSKLKCTNILAKHDQRNGMPPEIAYEVEKNRREMERRKLNQEQESSKHHHIESEI